MYEIGVIAQFEAAHRLKGDFGPATRMHGHTYRLEVIVRGQHLQEDGTLFDITALQHAVQGITADLNYRDLNEVSGLEEVNTTAEHMARYCWERTAQALAGLPLHSLRVVVWESPLAYAARDEAL